MKVILLQNIKGFGQIGDIKNVSDGYARNFLFPKKLAKIATDGAMKEVEMLQKKREVMDAKNAERMQKAAEVLKDTAIEFQKKASPAGTLFSSVTKQEIAEELTKKSGVQIEPDMIGLSEKGEHLKQMGDHDITVNLAPNLTIQIKISIKAVPPR